MCRPRLPLLLTAASLCLTLASFALAQQAQPSVGATAGQTAPVGVEQQAAALGQPLAQVAAAPNQLGQPMAVAPQNPGGAPFVLSPVDQQYVDQILQMWEASSSKIKTFDCKFERWNYDPVFGPGKDTTGQDIASIKSHGQLTYSKPDRGSFKINEIYRYVKQDQNQPGEYVLQEHEVGEHWVCNGKAIYEYKHDKKQLVVQALPPQLRGTAIVDGPLPFLFGAEAKKLKARYWIRVKQSNAATIWLEAHPRGQADAANYHHVEVMLERKTMMPNAIQVHMPNGQSRAVYMFQEPTVNGAMNKLFGMMFNSPRTPLGWKRVMLEAPQEPQVGSQAAKPQAATQR
jgi:TIGR03009 family protein